MRDAFRDFYRCPEDAASFALEASSIQLPFELNDLVDDLRLERYVPQPDRGITRRAVRNGYYFLRPLLSIAVRRRLQKIFFRGWDRVPFPRWPVDTTVEQIFEKLLVLALDARQVDSIPFIWFWPEGASSCVMMTHDVETEAGVRSCSNLMDIDEAHSIPSSFQIVPEDRYKATQEWVDGIRQRGFEINVQDLNHDGRLFNNHHSFLARAKSINQYVRAYRAKGFRAAVMYRNPDWYDALDVCYDMSIPNIAHLEPQRGGCCTVFPYFIGGILELPLTTTQDYSLFHILDDYSIELWKRQIALIQEKHGLISFIVHPDYIVTERARNTYLALLDHLAQMRQGDDIWMALPGEIDQWWRDRSQMQLVKDGDQWVIRGRGSDRARLAFASLENGRLTYTIANTWDTVLKPQVAG